MQAHEQVYDTYTWFDVGQVTSATTVRVTPGGVIRVHFGKLSLRIYACIGGRMCVRERKLLEFQIVATCSCSGQQVQEALLDRLIDSGYIS